MARKIKKQWLKKAIIGLIGRPLAREFDKMSRNVEATQKRLLEKVIHECRDTAFGADHGFAEIHGAEDYRRCVPIRDFEGHRPYVERMMNGEADVLFPGRPLFYNTTSGTSNKPKQIPISKDYFENGHKKLSRLWFYTCLRDNPGLFGGLNLSAVGAAVEGRVEDGTPFGSLSGVTYSNIPSVLKDVYAAPYPVLCIGDYQLKYYGMMRYALAGDVTYIVAANPSSLLKFHQVVMENWSDLVRDIREGTLRGDVLDAIEPAERTGILAALRPDPDRAAELERLMAEHGEGLRPKHYWPHLKCINTWKQGNCAQLLPKLDDYYPRDTAIREMGYQASEARAGVTLGNDWDCSALAANIYFFEFIEESQRDADEPEILLAHQLERGKRYYIIVTNTSGLFRYDINDVIEVTGFYNELPLFRFIRKGDGFTSLTGEKLTETQLLQAVDEVVAAEQTRVEHFTMCCDEQRYVYKLFVEFGEGTDGALKQRFSSAVDERLKSINPEYDCKRGSERLAPPILCELPPDSYERVKNLLVERGMAREGQYKSVYLQRKPQVLAVYEEVAV